MKWFARVVINDSYWGLFYGIVPYLKNIHAKCSACWLSESMSVNPEQSSSWSSVQKLKLDCMLLESDKFTCAAWGEHNSQNEKRFHFCRLFLREVERNIKSWFLSFFSCNVMTNWSWRSGEICKGITKLTVVVSWVLHCFVARFFECFLLERF